MASSHFQRSRGLAFVFFVFLSLFRLSPVRGIGWPGLASPAEAGSARRRALCRCCRRYGRCCCRQGRSGRRTRRLGSRWHCRRRCWRGTGRESRAITFPPRIIRCRSCKHRRYVFTPSVPPCHGRQHAAPKDSEHPTLNRWVPLVVTCLSCNPLHSSVCGATLRELA